MSREDRREYWHAVIEKHASSDMSAAAFCKEQNINRQRFYAWRRRFSCDSQSTEFIRLVPTSKASGSGIRIHLDHGISIEVDRSFDALTLREVIDALCTKCG
jgi:hypothetical protein